GTVERANLDGSNPTVIITGALDPLDVEVDSGHVYWANEFWVGRADLDGGNPEPFFVLTFNLTRGISVDSSHIYFTNANGGIGRADIDGQNPLINFMHLDTGDAPGDVASDASHLYWTDPFFLNNWIGRSDLDGQNQASFITGTSGPLGLTMDSQ